MLANEWFEIQSTQCLKSEEGPVDHYARDALKSEPW